MKKRILGLVAASAVAVTLVGAPAKAEEAPGFNTYAASADARALFVSLLKNELTVGSSHTDIAKADAPKASAHGVGLATPLINVSETEAAATSGQTKNVPETCSPLSLPDIPVLALQTACSSAKAAVPGGVPAADSTAKIAEVSVNATDVLSQTPVPELVGDTVDEVLTNLAPVFDALEEATDLDADALIGDLLEAILGESAGELVNVKAGETSASSHFEGAKLVTTSDASGAVVTVLDRAVLGPVLRITVGAADSTVTATPGGGNPVGSYDPALVRVEIAPDILSNLPAALVDVLPLEGAKNNTLVVPVGQKICLLPAPLTSCITAAHGESSTADGVTTVNTSAVRLDLLTGLEGGVVLALADTSASGGGNVPTPTQAPAPTPETPRSLPRTGLDLPIGATGLATIVALAGIGLVATRRSRDELV